MGLSREFKVNSRVLIKVQGCFESVSRKFQESLMGVLGVSVIIQDFFKLL